MMSKLETRIPPPLLLLAMAVLVWWLPAPSGSSIRIAAGVSIASLGLMMNAWPKRSFRRAGTTVNPLHPERSTVLVTSGLYRYSRNPMYLGYALALLGGVIVHGNPFGLVALAAFIGVVTRFQILPEERRLSARFPEAFAEYRRAVRRWI